MKTVLCLVLACTLCHANAREYNGAHNSNASEMSAFGSIVVVAGTMSLLAGSGTAVVESVEHVGESVVVVIKGATDASRVTLRMSGKAVVGASMAAGTAVSVVTMASGYALVVAGAVIAFIPNQAGKALLHHSRAS
ncbi:MAG: hypothetical protein WKG03_12540 [Telluria sp.]